MRRPPSLRLTLFFVALLAFAAADFEDIVTNIYSVSTSPTETGDSWKHSSLQGGGYLWIKGSGFSTRSPLSNRVTVGDLNCPVIEFYTTSTQVVCQIPPAEAPGSATIRVFVDNLRLGTCSSCYVYYDYWTTPQLKYLIPNAANPGNEIYYYGRQRVDSSTDVDFVKIGQDRCDSSNQNEFEPITFSPHSDQGAPCNIPKLEGGYYNVSQRNKENTGLAQKLNTVPTYRLNGDAYDFSVVPQISSVSNNVGSSEGQILTIQGSGFSTSGDNQVNLADTRCEILSQSSTEIKCELAARSTPISTQGYHSGLKLEVYPGKSLSSVKAGTAGTPSTVQSNLVFELPLGLGTSFSSKLTP